MNCDEAALQVDVRGFDVEALSLQCLGDVGRGDGAVEVAELVGAAFERDGPLDDGEAAIELGIEPGEMMPLGLRRKWSGPHTLSVAAFGRKPPD